MSTVAYHLLTEAEAFSEFHGGAISRWAANVLRTTTAVVVCPSADSTWKFSPEAIFILPSLTRYSRFRRYISRLPWALHRALLERIFDPLLKRLQPGDVIWIHNRPDFAIALTPHIHRAGGRVILHMHNAHLIDWPYTLMRQVHVDRLIFVSEFLLKQARHKFPSLGACSVLYNGADETIFYPASDPEKRPSIPIVLFAGRLVKDKGVHILVDAMKILAQQGVRLQLRIVGSSNFGNSRETDYITQLKANAPATITFLPYRSGVALGDLFREVDMFCSPSIWDEPFGLVNVEAFASGLPVISTRGGGALEIFANGGGILVERGSVEQLAVALRQLAEDTELRSLFGKQGYATFHKHFTWPVVRSQVQEIYQSFSI
ncbi:glycosyltransferase [Granulicella arctica]|uniref:Spore coat protein SA n=1 Tax=Granulicella arctica TaxID=940613 RepID=A0A7Y9TKX3_9BACT|nr:spore coat protein SA [Granulicella arctica]